MPLPRGRDAAGPRCVLRRQWSRLFYRRDAAGLHYPRASIRRSSVSCATSSGAATPCPPRSRSGHGLRHARRAGPRRWLKVLNRARQAVHGQRSRLFVGDFWASIIGEHLPIAAKGAGPPAKAATPRRTGTIPKSTRPPDAPDQAPRGRHGGRRRGARLRRHVQRL